jgi:hypothetical protein
MEWPLDLHLDFGDMSPAARTIVPGNWNVPTEVSLNETADLLCWSSTRTQQGVRPKRGLLREFLKVHERDNRAILRFAEKWGPLWLCEQHQLPRMHRLVDFGEFADALARNESPAICRVRQLGDGWYGEPLEAWRRLSGQAFLIIAAGSLARRGELPFETHEQLLADILGLPKDTPPEMIRVQFQQRLLDTALKWASPSRQWIRAAWELGLMQDLPERLTEPMVGRVRDAIGTKGQFDKTLQQPDALSEKINQWITDGGGLQLKAVWHDDRAEWQQEVRSLYAAIGVGLWNVIGDTTVNPKCEHCHRIFIPRTNTQRYCHRDECRRARDRENQRRSRASRADRADGLTTI